MVETQSDQLPRCEEHGEFTRLSCVSCEAPICPKCMSHTEVGLRCHPCAAPAVVAGGSGASGTSGGTKRARVFVAAGLVVAVVVGVLLTQRSSPESDVAPEAQEIVGTWDDEPDLTAIRGTATAVTLGDGTVLVAGGGVGALAVDAVEVFDPVENTWSEVAPLAEARRGHQAVVLDDGRVLVAGGLADGVPIASAELYDPETGSWSTTAPMTASRLGHSLVVLNDGRVLAAGGSTLDGADAAAGGQTIRADASAEIFDPAAESWSPTGAMATPRFEHTATRLRDGRVVMTGGLGPVGDDGTTGPLAATEIYDPAAAAFVTSTDLGEARANHAAVLLGADAVLVTGGVGGPAGDLSTATAEVFDVRAGTWTTTEAMGGTRSGHTATVLDGGQVLVAGGESVQRGTRRSLTSAEVFDFDQGVTGGWAPAGDMTCPRSEQAAVLLDDGTVLVVAGDAAFPGQSPIAQSCAERYVP